MDIGGLVYSFFNNPGPGGAVVLLVIGGACFIYYFLTRWILAAGKGDEPMISREQPESKDA